MISHILIENYKSLSVQRLSCDRYNILVAVAEIKRKKIEPKSVDTRSDFEPQKIFNKQYKVLPRFMYWCLNYSVNFGS